MLVWVIIMLLLRSITNADEEKWSQTHLAIVFDGIADSWMDTHCDETSDVILSLGFVVSHLFAKIKGWLVSW